MRKDSYVIGSTIYQLEDPGQWQSYDLSRSPGGHTDGVEAHTSKGKGRRRASLSSSIFTGTALDELIAYIRTQT